MVACPVVTACPVAGPTAQGRADLRVPACRTAGTPMAACPTGRCRTAALRTAACRAGLLRTAPRRTGHLRTAACRTAGSRTAARCLMAFPCPTAGRPTAGRDLAGRPGCRTGAGCRRTRTALTGRQGPARRAGHRVGTTGRVRPPRTRTPTAGAARPRRQVPRSRVPRCLAVAGLEDRPQARLTWVRSPTAPLGHLGHPGFLGLRRCASTRPQRRASMLPTAASGSRHHRGRRWDRCRNRPGR